MVAPVTSSVSQQIPAANTFQPGGNAESVRQREESQQTRPSGTSTAESQQSETRNNGRQEDETLRAASREEDNGQVRSRESRGSVIDLTV